MLDFSNVSLPFDVTDLITSGSGLLGLVGGFVLLGLTFLFAPSIIRIIRAAFYATSRNFDSGERYEAKARGLTFRNKINRTKNRYKMHYDTRGFKD